MENCFKEPENHFNESLKLFKDSFSITTRTYVEVRQQSVGVGEIWLSFFNQNNCSIAIFNNSLTSHTSN
jgi:hypothetical protein